ncbi:MAG: hypothetical protein E7663_07360 [Ruminococcaceae bacterium]|nr:hypothetical protein [Oscillospiraceae bacterium]
MKTYVLYNPLAGHGDSAAESKPLLDRFEGEVFHLDITAIDDLSSLIASLDKEDRVLICGGDGTLNRFINATDGVDIRCDVLLLRHRHGQRFSEGSWQGGGLRALLRQGIHEGSSPCGDQRKKDPLSQRHRLWHRRLLLRGGRQAKGSLRQARQLYRHCHQGAAVPLQAEKCHRYGGRQGIPL